MIEASIENENWVQKQIEATVRFCNPMLVQVSLEMVIPVSGNVQKII